MTNSLPTFSLDTTTLLTSIPGLLGFLPERSLVVLAFDASASIAVTARHDLLLDGEGRPTDQMRATLMSIASVCAREGIVATAVAIVDDRYDLPSRVYRTMLELTDAALTEAGVPGGVRAGFVVERFESGRPWYTAWWGLDGAGPADRDPEVPDAMGLDDAGFGCGLLGDPQSSPVALERSLHTGRVVMASRAEMTDSLGPVEHCTDAACGGRPRAMRESRSPAGDAKLLRAALKVVTAPQAPAMTCTTVHTLSRAVSNLRVRDALLVVGAGEHRLVAEAVWRDLTRRTRGTVRASAATMLAHLYYLGGEGACAGVALDVALDACDSWKLATLLNSALCHGVHPSMMREILSESYAVAAGLGVALPPLGRPRPV
ncbi:MAG: DUF4192 domain-containing protein [Gordonia sp. (in: high G+C Gram-positive bacteria)]|uniref:DUF4192 domain-containing protein n=1 Tax=Gordonia sp. (in: high G+C Gram-positive bacteria) TaxID=84139 RepID=UPI0039E2B87A